MKKIFVFACVSLFLVNCRKKENEPTDKISSDTSSSDQAVANAIWQDIFKQTDEASQTNGVGIRSCGTITLSPMGSFPTTLTIDFGNIGCLGNDGRFRKGKIEAVLTGRWRDSLTVITITPINYSVNNYRVSGTKRIENMGHVNGNLHYNVTVTNGEIIDPNNVSFTWNSNIIYKWIAGENTTFLTDGVNGILDDVYLIQGNYNGVNRDGIAFTAETTTDIRKELSCKWPVSGILNVYPQGLPTRSVNFGAGACDNIATVTVNNVSFNIQMQ